MIHLGAMVGRAISAHDSLLAWCGQRIGALETVLKRYRNEKDARDLVTAGTAAGVASAFGAPIGGVLFALEEIASSWTPSLTWKVFLTSMVAASLTFVLISAVDSAEEGQSFDGTIRRDAIEFYQPEESSNNVAVAIPAVFIGIIAGIFAAGFTAVNLRFIGLRKKYVAHTKWRRVVEPMVVMIVLVLLTVGLSAVYDCTPVAMADPKIVERLVGLHCPDGQYNEMATLLYAPGGETIKNLWSRHDETGAGRHSFGVLSLLILLAVYAPLACWTAGSVVPTGLIVPVILIGATIGRVRRARGSSITTLCLRPCAAPHRVFALTPPLFAAPSLCVISSSACFLCSSSARPPPTRIAVPSRRPPRIATPVGTGSIPARLPSTARPPSLAASRGCT